LTLSWAQMRRRYGGGAPEASLPSRFLEEIPKHLTERLDDKGDRDRVDLFAERREVRDTVKKNLFTGKTYNSVDNISQFFSERGMPPPRGLSGGTRPVPPAPSPAPGPMAAPPQAAAPVPVSSGGGKLLQMPLIPRAATGPVAPQSRPTMATPTLSGPRMGRTKKPFGPGSIVEHPRYGRGTVLRREGDGEDAKLTITFPGHGLKKLVEKFAGLKIES
jgi:DNA helicase-2/ATP-dependent DNA helicase PcrA